MSLVGEAVEAASPSGQGIYRGNMAERWMLRRISGAALLLPKEFDAPGRAGQLVVSGTSSEQQSSVRMVESLGEDDDAMRVTNIQVDRSGTEPGVIAGLSAERYVDDDMAAIMGVACAAETFTLGSESNSLSMFQVMRGISLAARTVNMARDRASQIAFFSRPEATMIQWF